MRDDRTRGLGTYAEKEVIRQSGRRQLVMDEENVLELCNRGHSGDQNLLELH